MLPDKRSRLSCFFPRPTWISTCERTPPGEIIVGINPDGPVDRSMSLVSVKAVAGEGSATLVKFACHGTVLGPGNLMVAANWVGAMR